MSISLATRLIDVTNLLISKGSNFLITIVLFAILSHGTDSQKFAELGYWWSFGVMVGGILMGGIGAALVRIVTTQGSIWYLVIPLMQIGACFTLLSILIWCVAVSGALGNSILTALAVALFGISMLAQTAVMGLLRAIEATRANIIASVQLLVVVPGITWAFIGGERELHQIFVILAIAFAFGTIGAFVCGRVNLVPLFVRRDGDTEAISAFGWHALSFTLTNVFSYAVLNIDFTLFRLIGTPEEFVAMAGGKVFFERFVVPLLSVFVGAITLRVLRYSTVAKMARINLVISPWIVLGVLFLVAALMFGYWIFVNIVRKDLKFIELQWVAVAAIGYLLYSFNSILLDLLVIRYNVRIVMIHAAGFILLAIALQASVIHWFGVSGWAIGWLVFNLCVAAVLWGSDLFSLTWTHSVVTRF